MCRHTSPFPYIFIKEIATLLRGIFVIPCVIFGILLILRSTNSKAMEDDILKLQELLKRAYEKLADCDDTFAGSDSWKSEEQQKLLNDIADALSIEEKDRL